MSTAASGDMRSAGRRTATACFHALAVAGVALQLSTSFGSEWLTGEFRGWWVLAHVGAAPLAIVGIAGVACLGAERFRPGGPATPLQQGVFFVLLAAAAVMLGTVAPVLLLLFGPYTQAVLLEVHQRAGIVVALALAAHLALVALSRREK